MTTGIETKKAWVVNYKGDVLETIAFTIEMEGSYGGTSPKSFYMADKGYKEGNTWADIVTYSEDEMNKLKKQKIAEHIETLKKSQDEAQKIIVSLQEQL